MLFRAIVFKSDWFTSNNIPESNFTTIPSPSRITSAFGMEFLISSACLSILRPIYAPAVPPTAPPIIAPTAVFPTFFPIIAPMVPPAAEPITVPFCVLVAFAQP